MKAFSLLFSLLSLTLAASLAPAAHVQVWVDGVSLKSGWIDYEKKIDEDDGDDNLCWAASASNIIDYWQDRYIIPEGIPTDAKIWETFKTACSTDNGGKDMGGNFLFAMQWWLGGDYGGTTRWYKSPVENWRAYYVYPNTDKEGNLLDPQPTFPIATNLKKFSGYYWDTVIPTEYYDEAENTLYTDAEILHLRDFLWLNDSESEISLSDQIVAQLQKGAPISLGIGNNPTEGVDKLAHAITLWGVEYNEKNGDISSLWITDSDDYNYRFGGSAIRQISTTVTDDTKIYLTNYTNNYGDIFITDAMGINLSESDTWNLVPPSPSRRRPPFHCWHWQDWWRGAEEDKTRRGDIGTNVRHNA
ncbi:MAG: IdeS/Mac family cysteine endopeptidase [Akkermansia sp.]|nr:IdeS/Mac family cysteine endopeptidase [Akkermansia sp.]